jgi:glycerol uptake facilitator-like aquaporin
MIADILGEFLGTFTFVIVILIMTDKRTTYNRQTIYILLTIAAALFFSRQFTVHSGGCLNPAIALGLETMMWLHEGDSKYLRRSYVYVIGPICGAVAAGCFYRYFWLPRKVQQD